MGGEIAAVAAAVVGDDRFAGLVVTLRRGPAPPGWDLEMVQDIARATRAAAAESLALPAVQPAGEKTAN